MQNRRRLFFFGAFNALTAGNGGDSERKRQILIGVAVLIGLGAAYSFYSSTAGSDEAKLAKRKIPYMCYKCDHIEHFTREELLSGAMRMGPEMGPPPKDCPECKGKQTMELAEACPNCDTVYLCEPPAELGMPREMGCVCPNCGMNLIDAHRKKYKKKE